MANRDSVMHNARSMRVDCICGAPMRPSHTLAFVWQGQYPDNAPYGVVLFRCSADNIECGTEAHIEVDA